MTPDWIASLLELQRRQRAAVLVTIAAVKGSAPRAAGTKMVVSADEVYGTIGGGHLEFTAIDIARRQLEGGQLAQLQRFPLGASLGQCCGGVVNLLFEPVAADAAWVRTLDLLRGQGASVVIVTSLRGALGGKLLVTSESVEGTLDSAQRDVAATDIARELIEHEGGAQMVRIADASSAADDACFFDPVAPLNFDIVLFGAGHVGRALVNVLANIPCRVTWVDGRDNAFPATIPGNVATVAIVATDAPEAEIAAAAPGSYFLVMTHDHALDERLSEQILRRGDYAYFGLIGSLSKRRQFERRLEARGVAAESIATMTCPIGSRGISGKEPGVIAVAIAAQLLERRAAALSAAKAPQVRETGDADSISPTAIRGR